MRLRVHFGLSQRVTADVFRVAAFEELCSANSILQRLEIRQQADRLVILPSYLSQVEESVTFCCRTVKEKNKKEQRLKASVRK